MSEDEEIDLEADLSYDGGEAEDERLAEEGLAILEDIQNEQKHIGYDPNAFTSQTFEF